jgi:hypothetical protein
MLKRYTDRQKAKQQARIRFWNQIGRTYINKKGPEPTESAPLNIKAT